MEDEEVERLIAELRETLRQTGFGWAAEQAEAALPPDANARIIAHALVNAAENVTVDLAQVEIASVRQLGVEEIVFKVDPGADGGGTESDGDGDGRVLDRPRATAVAEGNWLRGQQRRATLEVMAGYAQEFAALRKRLNGFG